MLEPVEAEFAHPPIFTDAQEEAMREEAIEKPIIITQADKEQDGEDQVSVTVPDSDADGSSTIGLQNPTREQFDEMSDIEKGKERIIVHFNEGEAPKQWSRVPKRQLTIYISVLV
ncbi:hypothetical protein L204_104371 [Cryptococcus depauperatus]